MITAHLNDEPYVSLAYGTRSKIKPVCEIKSNPESFNCRHQDKLMSPDGDRGLSSGARSLPQGCL